MRPLVVINVVGLTPGLLGSDTPHLTELSRQGFQAELGTVLPAVTCSAQATMLTGLSPGRHGVVGNGWYHRDLSEVSLWRQSNYLVEGEKVWERCRVRKPGFTCAKIFWWFNMYSTVDYSVTVRPIYPADGRKIPALYTEPTELGRLLELELGPFPFFDFWGPRAGIASSLWIAGSASRVMDMHRPDLTLVYLPHLDYDLQRHGPLHPSIAGALRDVDRAAGMVIDKARSLGMEVMVVSEYGITAVENSISINRILRREGFLRVQKALGWELLDFGASGAFAVSDHQVAHVYVRNPRDIPAVKRILENQPGIESVLDRADQTRVGLDHPRSGELVAVSSRDRWFDYYYWLDDALAPDFARTVDIHRKPGYDPCELFLDPEQKFIKLRIAWKLLRKTLGFRYLMDVIPLQPSLVRGSHGRLPQNAAEGPLLILSDSRQRTSRLEMAEVSRLMEETIFSGG